MKRLIRHLQSAPYADRIIGYLPFSGYSAEWQSWGLWQNELADYSEPAKRAWRKWLRRRYGANSPHANAEMPTPEHMLDDLVSADVPPHRSYLFLNTMMLDNAQRAAIHTRLERDGATAIWVYASGLYGEDSAGR